MVTTIPDCWPEDIKVDVVPPVVILNAQVSYLERKTQGILQVQVLSTVADGWIQHQLDVVAPALNGYRRTLLTAKHTKGMLYPVQVRAEGLKSAAQTLPAPPELQREAATQDEFIDLIREVFRSAHARSLIQSLIAMSNDKETRAPASSEGERQVPGNGEDQKSS